MNADLELARAVLPDSKADIGDTYDLVDGEACIEFINVVRVRGGQYGGWVRFDPLGAHFADVLAWLYQKHDGCCMCYKWGFDPSASGIKQAVYEAAKRVVMEGKE